MNKKAQLTHTYGDQVVSCLQHFLDSDQTSYIKNVGPLLLV